MATEVVVDDVQTALLHLLERYSRFLKEYVEWSKRLDELYMQLNELHLRKVEVPLPDKLPTTVEEKRRVNRVHKLPRWLATLLRVEAEGEVAELVVEEVCLRHETLVVHARSPGDHPVKVFLPLARDARDETTLTSLLAAAALLTDDDWNWLERVVGDRVKRYEEAVDAVKRVAAALKLLL